MRQRKTRQDKVSHHKTTQDKARQDHRETAKHKTISRYNKTMTRHHKKKQDKTTEEKNQDNTRLMPHDK